MSEPMTNESSAPWPVKYEPEMHEIVGQSQNVEAVLKYVKGWKRGQKALLLYGDPGVGKTATVRAVAKKLDLEVVELNASDKRNAAEIEGKAVAAATQMSLLGKGKIILVDELDGIYGRVDRGGVPTIKKLIEKSGYPVVMTANDAYKQSIRSLRDKCERLHFTHPDYRSIANRLEDIAKAEKVEVDKEALQAIGRRSGGDVRAAIMDLQSLGGKVEQKDVESLGFRDQEREIYEVLKLIFRSSSIETALQGMRETDKDPDELFLWVSHNLPLEYSGEDLARAYDVVSRADVFRGRIRRQQHWGYLRYVLELISAGVSAVKTEKGTGFVKYRPPDILLKMGRTKFRRALQKSAGVKVGRITHTSSYAARRTFPYLRIVCRNDKEAAEALAVEAELAPEELALIKGTK